MKTRLPLTLTCLAAAAALTLAGCSGSDDATTASSAQPTAAASGAPGGDGQGGGPGQGGGQFNGTFGIIAAVSGETLQVRGSDAQTSVTYTDDTTFTQQVTGSADDLTKGLCVSGRGATGDDDTITAESLTITEATDDGCASGFGGGGGQRPDGDQGTPPSDMPSMDPSAMPSDLPTDMPSGAPSMDPSAMPSGAPGDGGGQGGSFISGEIASIDGDTVTVKGSDDETTTFKIGDDTTITTTKDAASKDAVEGVCALAQGDTDDTGAVTATSIALSEATDGECTMGGGMGGGNR